MPEDPNLITTRFGSWQGDQYVAPAGIDTWNELQMAKYNNEYNYWLLQQQQRYNSPAAQVQRLKEAGLNPNFNSIEGAGNTSYDMATSKRGLASNVGTLGNQELGLMLNAFNSVLGAISQGVDMTKTISNTPSDIKAYRKALTESAYYRSLSDKDKATINHTLATLNAWAAGQNVEVPFAGFMPEYVPGRGRSGSNALGVYPGYEESGYYDFRNSPMAQGYLANIHAKEASAAAANANAALAELHSNIDRWKDSPEYREAMMNQIATQLEILGINKDLADWMRAHKDEYFALQMASGIVSMITRIIP